MTMSLEFHAWPPALVEAALPAIRTTWNAYGASEGPARERMVADVHAVPGGDELDAVAAEQLVDYLIPSIAPPHPASSLAGRSFGQDCQDGDVGWPSGPYRRCPWNPLHLVDVDEHACAICGTARGSEPSLSALLARDVPERLGALARETRVRGRVPLHPAQLAGRRLIKTSDRGRAWYVDLHDDGTCMEVPLADGNEDPADGWCGEWGCDSRGLLILGIGAYQLTISGAADGLCPGVEFRGEHTHDPSLLSTFRVGIIDSGGPSRRAIKWTSHARCFRITRAVGDHWVEAGPLDEELLFPDPGDDDHGPGVLMREASDGAGFTARSWDAHGIEYSATYSPRPGMESVWTGQEECIDGSGEAARCFVALVALQALPADSWDQGESPSTDAAG